MSREKTSVWTTIAFCATIFLSLFLLGSNVLAQNPNSGTTTTGQILTVKITGPANGAIFSGPAPCEVPVQGLVTLSSLPDTLINIMYVLDLSGSTAFIEGLDVNGDGVVNAEDDFNNDGTNGDILDAEIAGTLALNSSINNLTEVRVGIIGFATNAAAADVSPESGFQRFTSPPQADKQPNGIPDIEEVLRSLDTDVIRGAKIGLFTPITEDSLRNNTNFEAALQVMLGLLGNTPAGQKNIVYFLSDGENERGGPLDDEIAAAAAKGIVIHTVGITEDANPTELSAIAAGTGGTFQQVDDPTQLRVLLPQTPLVGVSGVNVNGQTVALSSAGTFATTINSTGGLQTVAATATADDGTDVTADISVVCKEPLECSVTILSPQNGAEICGDSVTVVALSEATGGVPPYEKDCSINELMVPSMNDTFSLTIPLDVGANMINVVCSFVDSLGDRTMCMDEISVTRIPPPSCQIEINSPLDGSVILADSVKVTGFINITGGHPPFSVDCNVNGVTATVSDSVFRAVVPCTPGPNTLVATCLVTDSCGIKSVCTDTVDVECITELTCSVEITSPDDGALICGDSVRVTAATSVSGGVPPITAVCTVNGVLADVTDDLLTATIPVTVGENAIEVVCTFTDSLDTSVTCRDTIMVNRATPPSCVVHITAPPDGQVTFNDSVKVTAVTTISGGEQPFDITCNINGHATTKNDTMFMAMIPLNVGDNTIVAECTIVDSCNNKTVCSDTITVVREVSQFECTVDIVSPAKGSLVCGDSVKVTAVTSVSGGTPPITTDCTVNGIAADVIGNSVSATIPLTVGLNNIEVLCTFVDSLNRKAVCGDTSFVVRPEPPVCTVEIVSPQNNTATTDDSIKVTAVTSISGGAEPLSIECEINGITTTLVDTMFMASVPLNLGPNTIIATCTITDSCGATTVCADTILMTRGTLVDIQINITAPLDNDIVCGDSTKVTGTVKVSGGIQPFTTECDVNGVAATVADSVFTATVPLSSGRNTLIATCTVTDALGNQATKSDTISVVLDDQKPTCQFTADASGVSGTFIDGKSGIASIIPVDIHNGTLTVEPFSPGKRKVNFRIDVVDPNRGMHFSIEVADVCGNSFICDPIFLNLEAGAAARQYEFDFPSIDRYFEITNHGLSEVRIDLNGHKFKLLTDARQAALEFNAFTIPHAGRVKFDMKPYLKNGQNSMFLVFEGSAGATADVLISDFGEDINFVLDLQTVPEQFRLAQNYPNPFNPATKIQYDVPQKLEGGVDVKLRIFNLLGEVVTTLVDERKFPGQYTIQWDGTNDRGEPVSSGMYIYQFVAGEFKATKRMLFLK